MLNIPIYSLILTRSSLFHVYYYRYLANFKCINISETQIQMNSIHKTNMSLKNILFYNLDKVYKFMTASEKPILFFVNPKSGQGKYLLIDRDFIFP